MAVFKCKMCGAILDVNSTDSVITCNYCDTPQTLPKLDSDRRINLYDRANHFRRNNEFDKATNIYEQILNEDSTDAEAYWSIVLCRFGIEYVEEEVTHKRIPTVHRVQYTSIFDDDNYKSALQYADIHQRGIYESEARKINEIQKNILDISQTILQDLFTMIMLVDLDKATIGFEAISSGLSQLAEEIGVKISVQHDDIFRSMHRI